MMSEPLGNGTVADRIDGDDLLWRHLKSVPAFRALLRAVESRFYRLVELPSPTLDLGCGDGHFAQMTFSEPLSVGVDPWWGPLEKSRQAGAHQLLLNGDGDALPFPDHHFGSVVSNSVLEHIDHVDPVLAELNRVLRPGGTLMITMPSHQFTNWLGGAQLFERIGAGGLANAYRRFFNYIARHVRTDAPSAWASRLADSGFKVERWQYYFSKRALWALEWGHVQGLPSAILHALTGHWILAPWRSNLARTEAWLRPFYDESAGESGAYVLFVASKQGEGAIEAFLPGERPFTADELASAEGPGPAASSPVPQLAPPPVQLDPMAEPSAEPTALNQEPEESPREREAGSVPFFGTLSAYLSPFLLALSLGTGIIAQVILSARVASPYAALRWYGVAALSLSLLLWRANVSRPFKFPHFRAPRIPSVDKRRWWLLLSLFLVILAYGRSGASGGEINPTFSLLLWMGGIAAAVYALDSKPGPKPLPGLDRFTLAVSISLFLVALVVRAVDLGGKPFILNGVESSIGLDALNVANGYPVSPFSTGWLTNPTLIYYLVSIPIKLLGPTVLGIRILSPLVGALTVVILFLLGSAIWGRSVGLIAAALLAGSHFHVHYSRLGMTNIWDPLATLLALGLAVYAWQLPDQPNRRRIWMAAGCATGLNAYLFTSSRLLPLILLLLFSAMIVFARNALRTRWRNVLVATLLAAIVALPQLLYYRDSPGTFMDRANSLGIDSSQSGWIDREAERSGKGRASVLGDQFLKAVLAFNFESDNSPAYRARQPLLSFGPSLLFALGIVIALLKARESRYMMLLTWVIITMLFAGALLVETPSSHRLLIVAPALSLLAAVALVEIGSVSERLLDTRKGSSQTGEKRFRYLLPALLMIAVIFSINDVMFYFGGYEDQETFADRNTEIAHRVSDYLNSLNGEWTAYFHGPPSMYVGFPTIPFLVRDFQTGLNLFDVMEPDSELPAARSANRVHLLLPERMDELGSLQDDNPGGELIRIAGSYADPLFIAFEVADE